MVMSANVTSAVLIDPNGIRVRLMGGMSFNINTAKVIQKLVCISLKLITGVTLITPPTCRLETDQRASGIRHPYGE